MSIIVTGAAFVAGGVAGNLIGRLGWKKVKADLQAELDKLHAKIDSKTTPASASTCKTPAPPAATTTAAAPVTK